MALSTAEVDLIDKHRQKLADTAGDDELLWRYYRLKQRVEQLGMAIPPSMRKFLVISNWCRTQVDTINSRQQVRAWTLPGEEAADPTLQAIAVSTNLPTHVSMFNVDRMIYGRGLLSVGTNARNRLLPWVRAESPRQMSAEMDPVSEEITDAVRLYGGTSKQPEPIFATIYLRDQTIWARRGDTGWVEDRRDQHNLGTVPVAMHLNRRMSGELTGESQMTDLIPLVDSAARSLTNMQFAQEAHGVPSLWATGVSRGDFTDADGNPIPQFEAYFDAIKMLTKSDAKWGQFSAADLKNFETAMRVYGTQASLVTGFPARYWGVTTTNPPAEGAIHADESQLNRSVEEQNEQLGVTLGWVGGLAYQFATGDAVEGNRVHVSWHDPATPTVSQREDALAKRRAAGVLSREGYWDELGWSEPRKAMEREYLRREAADQVDPYLQRIREAEVAAAAEVTGGAAEPAAVR